MKQGFRPTRGTWFRGHLGGGGISAVSLVTGDSRAHILSNAQEHAGTLRYLGAMQLPASSKRKTCNKSHFPTIHLEQVAVLAAVRAQQGQALGPRLGLQHL